MHTLASGKLRRCFVICRLEAQRTRCVWRRKFDLFFGRGFPGNFASGVNLRSQEAQTPLRFIIWP